MMDAKTARIQQLQQEAPGASIMEPVSVTLVVGFQFIPSNPALNRALFGYLSRNDIKFTFTTTGDDDVLLVITYNGDICQIHPEEWVVFNGKVLDIIVPWQVSSKYRQLEV